MDLRDSPEEARFRAEARAWLAAHRSEAATRSAEQPADRRAGQRPGETEVFERTRETASALHRAIQAALERAPEK